MNFNKKNKVHLQQINPDNSNDWRYIFREEIKEENRREEAEKEEVFL